MADSQSNNRARLGEVHLRTPGSRTKAVSREYFARRVIFLTFLALAIYAAAMPILHRLLD
jgi:hypothetical protein